MTGGAPAVARCISCDAARVGPFCAECGQRRREGRLTVTGVAGQVAQELIAVDRGMLHTIAAVTRAPGRVARDYAAGRTTPYVGPAKYFLLLAGVAQLLALRSGFLDAMVAGMLEGYARGAGPSTDAQGALLAFATRYFVSLVAIAVPLYALWTRLLFRRAGFNYAEHVVLAMYTGAQLVAALTLFAVLERATRVPYLDAVFWLGALVYQAGALRAFTGASWPGTAWRLPVAAALTLVSGSAVLAAVLAAAGLVA